MPNTDEQDAALLGYKPIGKGLFMKRRDTRDAAYDLYVFRHAAGYDASYKRQTANRTAWYDNGIETIVAENCPTLALADEMLDHVGEAR